MTSDKCLISVPKTQVC